MNLPKIEVVTTVEIPAYCLYMSLMNAIDSGYADYWFNITSHSSNGPERHTRRILDDGDNVARCVVGAHHECWSEYLARQVVFEDGFVKGQDAEDPDTKFTSLTLGALVDGLQLMAASKNANVRKIVDRLRECDTDAGDDDVILQYALFGEVLYG